jgi:DNA-binding LacI/PurR family transcriptional regulator
MVDAWIEGAEFDTVLQDNYLGGFLAAKYLVERNHRRIGWIGAIGASAHSRERFGGAVAALAASDLEIPRELRVESSMETLQADVRRFLDQASRPCACLALWRLVAIEIWREARRRGMVLGRDIEIVGWSTEELFHENYAPHFGDGPLSATIVWNMKDAANAALDRIDERRRKPELALLRSRVPVRLKTFQ